MKRGPIPKPPDCCGSCGRFAVLTRGFCKSCYVIKLRSGEIERLPRKVTPTFLTEQQEEVLTGGMLGDACLFRHKPTHKPHLLIQRAASDRTYAEWQNEIFQGFVSKFYDGQAFDSRTGKTYHWVKIRGIRSNVFCHIIINGIHSRIKLCLLI